ncbi:hypothetical protein PINS_up000771 [Pythium insidiosum]|nr:hypothetical protein PINS_up000771 [Pythium insidiosum]
MDFTPPTEADVDMAIHEDALLDINLAAQYAPAAHGGSLIGNNLADAFIAGMIPGVAPLAPGGSHPPSNQPPQSNQPYSSVEEYAALMGVKLENGSEEMQPSTPMTHLQAQMNTFNVSSAPSDPAKIQANAAYFENLYRERAGVMGASDLTSMTLPAGVGSGMASSSMFVNNAGPSPSHSHGVYDRSTELAFNQMNQRMYDPTSGFTPAAVPMHKPAAQRVMQVHDLGAQTLSPELLSAMIKNNQVIHNFENLSEDEKAALIKEEKSRERNRDHSRKSRLRKKEYVESLKMEVQQLQIYQQVCEYNQDLIALVTAEPKAVFLFTSSSYARVLGYQGSQLIPGQASFLDLVHPSQVAEVRSIFQKFSNIGDFKRFRFRIRSADGEFFDAETSARVAEKGVVCSTRVDRDI